MAGNSEQPLGLRVSVLRLQGMEFSKQPVCLEKDSKASEDTVLADTLIGG